MKKNRPEQIINILQDKKKVSVAELTASLNVSDMTIRRDLIELEKRGALIRYHGGAYIADNVKHKPEYNASAEEYYSEKEEIAYQGCKYLKKLLTQNSINSVTFGGGSTIFAMVKKIDFSIPVSIITDTLKTAEILSENPDNTVIMVGGVLNFPGQNAIGYLAEQMLNDLSIDYIFMGTSAIDDMGNVYCYSNFEASILKKMLSKAKHIVVLADISKIGKSNLVRVFKMNDQFTLITNKTTPEKYLKTFLNMGVEIITV